ncbi:MAG: zf-HC2 domain-containing protein [Clostridia bacterium]|nr:zf-HC2 domain-containing protein [Clostridia bacterium]
MKCNEFELLIDAYVDGELKETKAFEEHLKTCETCRLLYEETMAIKTLLQDLDEVPLPDDFEATLHDKLVEASKEQKIVPFYRHPLVKTVSSVAAIGIISLLAFKIGTLMPAMDEDHAEKESTVAMDMASDDGGNMFAGEYSVDEEAANEMPSVAFSESVSDLETESTLTAASLRFTSLEPPYTNEEVNYVLDDGDLNEIETWLIAYDVDAVEVSENQLSFYMALEDLDHFKSELSKHFQINSEVVLDYRDTIAMILNEYTMNTNEKMDQNDAQADEYKQSVENTLSEQVAKIEKYQLYKYVIVSIKKE